MKKPAIHSDQTLNAQEPGFSEKTSRTIDWVEKFLARIPLVVFYLPLIAFFTWSMIISVDLWAKLYLLGYVFLAVGLGMLVYYLPKAFPLPGLSRFLAGACFSPFLIGGWMLAITYIWPHSPRVVAAVGPFAIGLILIAVFAGRFVRRMGRVIRRQKSERRKLPNLAFLLLVTYLLGLVIVQIFQNTDLPIIEHDAVFYFSEAVPLAQERTPASIQGITDAPDGTHEREYHTFFYPALIAHGLLVSPVRTPGSENDFAARMSLQINFVLMLAALAALGFSFRRSGFWIGLMSMLVFFLFQQLGPMSNTHGRDTYRIIPLLLLIALLLWISPPNRWKKISWPTLGAVFVLTGCAVHGHIIGILNLALICIAWAAWMVINRGPIMDVVKVGATVLISVLINGERIFAFLVYFYQVERPLMSSPASAPVPSLPYLPRLISLLSTGSLALSSLILFICFLFVIWSAFFRKTNWSRPLALLVLITLFSLVFLVPGFNKITGIALEELFFNNYRYMLHWYPLAAVVLACFIVEIGSAATRTSSGQWIKGLALVGIVIVFSAFAVKNIREIDRDVENHDALYFEIISDYQKVMAKLPKGKHLLTNDDRFNYYLDNQPIELQTSLIYKLRTATDDAEIREELDRLNIGAIIWMHFDKPQPALVNSPLYRYTKNTKNCYIYTDKLKPSTDLEAIIVDPQIVPLFQ